MSHIIAILFRGIIIALVLQCCKTVAQLDEGKTYYRTFADEFNLSSLSEKIQASDTSVFIEFFVLYPNENNPLVEHIKNGEKIRSIRYRILNNSIVEMTTEEFVKEKRSVICHTLIQQAVRSTACYDDAGKPRSKMEVNTGTGNYFMTLYDEHGQESLHEYGQYPMKQTP